MSLIRLTNEDKVIMNPVEKKFGGSIEAIPSKSYAHRLFIALYLAGSKTVVHLPSTSKDIEATRSALADMDKGIIDVGESGSTLRFLLPVIAVLGKDVKIEMHGRLPIRPLSPLYEEMQRHGVTLGKQGSNPLSLSGKLTGGEFEIAGNISSQFITGLLLALPLAKKDSILRVTGRLQSRPYVDITLEVLEQFGVVIEEHQDGKDTLFFIKGGQKYTEPKDIHVPGDWSNAAFWLVAGAISSDPVTVTGLDKNSKQGDKAVLKVLKKLGANVTAKKTGITVSGGALKGTHLDASDVPDLIPILSVAAAAAEGDTTFENIERLRIKESDRVSTIREMLACFQVETEDTGKSLIVHGGGKFHGGIASSHNDHRIAMSLAVASLLCAEPVTITGASAVEKSYPAFYDDFEKLMQ